MVLVFSLKSSSINRYPFIEVNVTILIVYLMFRIRLDLVPPFVSLLVTKNKMALDKNHIGDTHLTKMAATKNPKATNQIGVGHRKKKVRACVRACVYRRRVLQAGVEMFRLVGFHTFQRHPGLSDQLIMSQLILVTHCQSAEERKQGHRKVKTRRQEETSREERKQGDKN